MGGASGTPENRDGAIEVYFDLVDGRANFVVLLCAVLRVWVRDSPNRWNAAVVGALGHSVRRACRSCRLRRFR